MPLRIEEFMRHQQRLERAESRVFVSLWGGALGVVIRGDWLLAGSHLDLIGSFTPLMREADDGCFAGASLDVGDAEALQKSGDLIGPLQRGVFAASDVRGTLAMLANGEATGLRDVDERTVFKSVGIALEDLAAARLVYEGA